MDYVYSKDRLFGREAPAPEGQGYPILFAYDDYKLKQFVSLGTRYIVDEDSQYSVFYNATAKAVKLSYQNQWLNFEILSDDFNVKKAGTFGLQISAIYRY